MCCSDLPVYFFLLSRHDFISIVWHFGTADCEREKKELLGIKIGDFFISGSLETLFAGKIDWTQNWRRDKRRFVTSVFVMAISNNSTTSGSAGIYGWSELWVWAKNKHRIFLPNSVIFMVNSIFFSCERHARAAASDFAKSCVHYINTNLPGNVQVSVSHTDFMKRFIECFSEHFETEFARRRASQQKTNGTANSIEEEPDRIEPIDVPKPSKPFFRRLSFKGLKKGKVSLWSEQFQRFDSVKSWFDFARGSLPLKITLSKSTIQTNIRHGFCFSLFFPLPLFQSRLLCCCRHCFISIIRRRLMHPEVGRIKLNYRILWLNAVKSVKLICSHKKVSISHRRIKNGKSVNWLWSKPSVVIY